MDRTEREAPQRLLAGRLLGLAGLCLLLSSGGCEDQSPAPAPAPPAPPPSPEVRWERFLTDFRSRLASNPNGLPSYGGSDSYYGDYSVASSELIPPETENGVYRAKLVIKTKSSITVYNTEEDDPQPQNGASNPAADAGDAALKEILGVNVATESGGRPPLKAPIETRDFAEEIVCELAYVENRWILKTELDPETSAFLSAAFRMALERQ